MAKARVHVALEDKEFRSGGSRLLTWRRLKRAGDMQHALEYALDWFADGVALVRADSTVVYANESFQAIARRDDGIRLRKGLIEFADAEARNKFKAAIATVLRLRAGTPDRASATDFVAARSAGGQPYMVAVRPSIGRSAPRQAAQAAIVFLRELGASFTATKGTLRELFGLTEAEAALAQALQSGIALGDYARTRSLTLNTVYTHLRRLREKAGCNRMPELVHMLNELCWRLRAD
jgi:DNA-binding CsgD family transcriptional regulator